MKTIVDKLDKALGMQVFIGRDGKEFLYEARVKLPNGNIKYFIGRDKKRYEPADIPNANLFSVESNRPYVPGQCCDGTIGQCVMALYYDFCNKKGLNADELMKEAYEEEHHEQDWAYAKEIAEWEGVSYPAKWGKAETQKLLKSLHEINYHQLAGVVDEKIFNVQNINDGNL